ncbi:MAG: hypothetical protein CVU11_07395 [Bacteroidetes bacterium HGW-Bacteroidetes-6]|jgi:hypothetical protein|nr:MAG: hypothetical protein CVU11_07395 [Bacteroidetes bacterium HGW-Bacteroidetes-6]
MKKLNPVWILLAAMLVLASCKKDDDTNPTPTNPSTPSSSVFTFFKTGASWTYDTYDSDGGAHFNQTYTINSISAQNYATVNWNVAGLYSYTVYWYADNNKFSMLCYPGDTKMLIFCDADPTVGESWAETWIDSTTNVTDSCYIIATNETVTVPAGTFTNCIKIKETTTDDPLCYKYYWLSLSAGVIKTEGTTAQDYPTIIYEDLSAHN